MKYLMLKWQQKLDHLPLAAKQQIYKQHMRELITIMDFLFTLYIPNCVLPCVYKDPNFIFP